MKYFSKAAMITIYITVIFFTELTLSVRLRVTGAMQDASHRLDSTQNTLSSYDTKPTDNKRACNGFPCMYSHLGSKAAYASLYNTLAGFIDECFSDPNCDPGRRKRDNTDRIKKLMETPISKLHIFKGGKSKTDQ